MVRLRRLVMVLLALGTIGVASVRPSYAATTDHVTTCAASGTGSLPSVVASAAAGDTVVFDQDCSGSNAILLSSTVTVSKSLTIDGSGHTMALDGGSATATNAVKIFQIGAVTTLKSLTLQNGSAIQGGAIDNFSTLTVMNCTFSQNGNAAIWNEGGAALQVSNSTFVGNGALLSGGAITNEGTLTVTGSVFSQNFAEAYIADGGAIGGYGGAIENSGTASIGTTTFSANTATRGGGAIDSSGKLDVGASTFANNSAVPNSAAEPPDTNGGAILDTEGAFTVSRSTFSQNQATADGGAIENYAAIGIISNSTFVGNSAAEGGAIDNVIDAGGHGYPYLKLFTSTFSGNAATSSTPSGGAVFNHGGTLIIHGTILVNSPDGDNCVNGYSGSVGDGGYNLTDSSDVCGQTSTGDLVNTNPMLGALANNGGPTQTMVLQAGSPAIDDAPVSTAICLASDGRGYVRPDDSETVCDIGAYESGAAPPAIVLTSSANPSSVGQQVTYTASVSPAAATGTIAFLDGAATIGGCGSQSMSNGQAACAVSYASTGSHAITAVYTGDGTYAGSTSAALTQNVDTSLSGYPTLSSGAYNLRNASLSGAYLVNANLAGANLSNATLVGANLSGANLTGANLTGANLRGANLTGADLTNANLTQVNLRGAIALSTATITGVVWKQTTCPDGTTSNQNGGTCQGH